MTSAAQRARNQFAAREVRPTERLCVEDVPPLPTGVEPFIRDDAKVYDTDLDGDPCRWRYDGRGLKTFIRYYPDHKTANAFPWKQLYERNP